MENIAPAERRSKPAAWRSKRANLIRSNSKDGLTGYLSMTRLNREQDHYRPWDDKYNKNNYAYSSSYSSDRWQTYGSLPLPMIKKECKSLGDLSNRYSQPSESGFFTDEENQSEHRTPNRFESDTAQTSISSPQRQHKQRYLGLTVFKGHEPIYMEDTSRSSSNLYPFPQTTESSSSSITILCPSECGTASTWNSGSKYHKSNSKSNSIPRNSSSTPLSFQSSSRPHSRMSDDQPSILETCPRLETLHGLTDADEALERSFQRNKNPTQSMVDILAEEIGWSPEEVKIWFEKRNMKWRRDEGLPVIIGSVYG